MYGGLTWGMVGTTGPELSFIKKKLVCDRGCVSGWAPLLLAFDSNCRAGNLLL